MTNSPPASGVECAPGCVGATPPSYATGGSAGSTGALPPISGSAGSSSVGGASIVGGGFGGSDPGGGNSGGGNSDGSNSDGSGPGGGNSGGSNSGGTAGAAGASGAGGTPSDTGNGGSAGAPSVDPDGPPLPRALPGATAMVSDPFRDRLYVAIGRSALEYPNSIVTFDPSAGYVIADTFAGAHPDSLAISDDGTTLWVGLHDTSSVLEVDISGDVPAPIQEYPLPPTDFPPYPHAAGPMVVLPGTTSSLAVSLHYDALSPSLAGVVVLDAGIARPLRLPGHTGASRLTRGPDGYLLGFNNLHTGFGVYSIAVSADGLTQTEHASLISGFDTNIAYDSNTLFGTDGAVISVTNPEIPIFLGRLPATGPVLPDVAAGVVWVLQAGQSPAEPSFPALVLVDLQTFSLLGSIEFATEVLTPRHFVRSASGVFAFIAGSYVGTSFEPESGVYWMRP